MCVSILTYDSPKVCYKSKGSAQRAKTFRAKENNKSTNLACSPAALLATWLPSNLIIPGLYGRLDITHDMPVNSDTSLTTVSILSSNGSQFFNKFP